MGSDEKWDHFIPFCSSFCRCWKRGNLFRFFPHNYFPLTWCRLLLKMVNFEKIRSASCLSGYSRAWIFQRLDSCPRKKQWLLEGRVPAFKLRWHRLWRYRDERRTSFIAEESRPTGASYLFAANFYPRFSAVTWLTDWPMQLLEKNFFQDWFLCTVGLYGIVHCRHESYKSESVRSWLHPGRLTWNL